jgi:LCP family protein required for cell wall assembly
VLVKRVLVGLVALVLGAAAGAGLWLTRRPYTYEAPEPSPSEATREGEGGAVTQPPPLEEEDIALGLDVPPEELPEIVQTVRRPTPRLLDTENYLLVGVDHTRSGGWGRADTIIVAVYDDDSEHLGLVSIPRDLHVDVPGHGPARVNATLRIATRTSQDPVELVRDVVSETLAIPIHHVVVGDIGAFERTIDRLGGVDVDVPCPIIDNFIDARAEGGRRLLDMEAGRRHMDGATAAMYVRSRHGRSDWDRARRQQAVLFGVRDRVRGLGPTEWLPVLSDALDEGVTTTMSRLELIALGRRFSRITPEHMHGLLLGRDAVRGHRTRDGRSVLLPEYDAIDAALAHLFEAPAPGAQPERHACPPADAAVLEDWGARSAERTR